MHAAIHAAYEEVRRLFFPRWDKARSWSLQISAELPCFGCCNRSEKIIVIRLIPVGDGLRLLLIHEICHCCAGFSHGPAWQRRMGRAAAAAARLGMGELATMLSEEAAGAPRETVTAASVYAALRSCVADFPAADFDEIKTMVCRRLGLCMDEFETTYLRARRVFDEALQGHENGRGS